MATSPKDDFGEEQRPQRNKWTWHIPLDAILGVATICFLGLTLIGLLVPSVGRVRESAARTTTMNKLSHCAKAVHLGHDQLKKYPPYYGPYGNKEGSFSFHTHLLPYVDEGPLYSQQTPDPQAIVQPYFSFEDPTVAKNGAGAANYPVNLRLFYTQGGLGELGTGAALIFPKMRESFPDGVSMTLLFATKYHHCGPNGGSLWSDTNALSSLNAAAFGVSMALWQVAPTQAACDPSAGTAVSFDAKAIQVAICDASVRSVAIGVSQATWQAVHTPGAGDAIGADWEGN